MLSLICVRQIPKIKVTQKQKWSYTHFYMEYACIELYSKELRGWSKRKEC
jgi:hypothetical protein